MTANCGTGRTSKPDVRILENSLVTADLRSVYPPFHPEEGRGQAGSKNLTHNAQVQEVLHRAGRRVGLEKYTESIVVLWNNRFTNVAGRTTFKENKIELASKLWGHLTEEEKRETLVHEACHLFTYEKCFRQNHLGFQAHGREWRQLMKACGFENPAARLERAMPTLNRSYLTYCRCDTHLISGQMFARIKNKKTRLLCTVCNTLVRVEPYAER